MSIVEIVVALLGVPLFITVGLAIYYYHKIARQLKGGKGWGLFRFGAALWLTAFAWAVVQSITEDITYIYITDLSLIAGSVILAYALIQIRFAIQKVVK